jgi:AraC family ethanolamine operon transcriptional activator
VKRNTGDVLEQADALPFWSQDYTQLSKGVFSGAENSVSLMVSKFSLKP